MTAATLESGLLKWAASTVLLVPGDLDKSHSRANTRAFERHPEQPKCSLMFTFAAMLFIVNIHIKKTISDIRGTVELRNASTFARVLRDARIREGITQEELAKRVGKSRSWVISVESGRQQPTIGAAIAAMRALNRYLDVKVVSEESQAKTNLLLEHLGRK